MSGHSKWASIKHKKGAADAKRGQTFTKIIKEMTVAAKMGGGDPEANPRLRAAILKAKAANMPKDNIERAIKKGTGELEGMTYTEITYEGYAPGGVAIIINTLTDNKNRTAADIRNILAKHGGNLGETNCVSYLFNRKGLIDFDASKYKEDDILNVALEANALDVSTENDTIEVTTAPDDFMAVVGALEKAGFQHTMAEIQLVPDVRVALEKEKTGKVLNLIDKLDDHDDVQSVASNLDIPDDYEPEE